MKDFQHEQLFTELTPEQAAVIEGGALITINQVYAQTAGADGNNDPDDLYFKINNVRVGEGTISMRTKDNKPVGLSRAFTDKAKVGLWDNDTLTPDDDLGGFTVGATPVKNKKVWVSSPDGSSSTYLVSYSVSS